ncbi:MAG: glutamate 5-kinase [Desulfobacteraceae bacterium]|nr:glutamate 5-kinase [Desulfobacteraceae bacterium]MCB9494126.1 glutamate 5-kinase [Desulfobacteraceae bacterium]
MINNREYIENARRIVIKLGSNVLTGKSDLNISVIASLSKQVNSLIESGRQVIIVSSGAMAAGLRKMDLKKRPVLLPERQAVAAVGQTRLIMEYDRAFSVYGRIVSQLLLTSEDLGERKRYLNARNTLNTLLSKNIIPIINENDTVSVEEIAFGDNDNLSAMVAMLMDADLLINLTDIDGVYTKDPRRFKDAVHIKVIDSITEEIEKLAGDIPGALGTGGMKSKIRAAKKVMMHGIPMIITNGLLAHSIDEIFSFAAKGTFFVPLRDKIKSRKSWIAFNLKAKGSIVVDDGARKAIVENGKSLLPGGIVSVNDDFHMGEPVKVFDKNGTELGSGLVNYSSADIRRIAGRKTDEIKKILGLKPYDEVVHRDNLVITLTD